ncbi:MAG: ABC transporter ATP-binding protein [Gammaproteobacteria bacterium RIFCSPHIGHO2_12_FULL_45_12]|nr:MAG: ABC transporter ATP-binding protein [Gammaproteobacteria bacterium RIFCSPHIGHO2_12_FULL_45_12]
MSHLVTLDNVSLAYGLQPLLDGIKFQISAGERVCLIGRNGAGKSSLLKIIEGTILPDSGQVWRKPALRLARLTQELPQNTAMTVYEFISEGLADTGKLLADYHALTHKLESNYEEKDLVSLEKLQHKMDVMGAWQFDHHMKNILTRLDLNADLLLSQLSGGWQRRAALAKALVASPELLLLDEPTNHLDINAIQWLEDQLMACQTGLLFITHDRALLQRLATRIVELDRGQLTSWPGDYQNFLLRKEEMLHAEQKQHADFDKKLAIEETWIRQGIKARRTRNEGRVRALEAMREQRAARREMQGKANFNVTTGEKSGQLVAELTQVSHAFSDKPVIRDFSLRVIRGDKIALIGPNGVGKSTLLNILLGNVLPDQGTVTRGTKLQIAYFDQLRMALDLDKTVMENVAEGRDFIEVGDKKRHIISYLGDFLFTPERAMTPVKALSGGECNRLLLARLFSQPANLLVMDEPTNDLDIETLELLEELLTDYQGTLLLVSHDRAFVDNVVTSTLVFEGQGKISEYMGGYQDALREVKGAPVAITRTAKVVKSTARQLRGLSFKEQQTLTALPVEIERLESELADRQLEMAEASFYKGSEASIQAVLGRIKEIEAALEAAYQAWHELETRQNARRDS